MLDSSSLGQKRGDGQSRSLDSIRWEEGTDLFEILNYKLDVKLSFESRQGIILSVKKNKKIHLLLLLKLSLNLG